MNDRIFKKKLLEAESRVRQMDAIDGFAERHIKTIYLALEAGIKNPQSGAHFDALFMLKDLLDSKHTKNN